MSKDNHRPSRRDMLLGGAAGLAAGTLRTFAGRRTNRRFSDHWAGWGLRSGFFFFSHVGLLWISSCHDKCLFDRSNSSQRNSVDFGRHHS